jgi:hypothetical protein
VPGSLCGHGRLKTCQGHWRAHNPDQVLNTAHPCQLGRRENEYLVALKIVEEALMSEFHIPSAIPTRILLPIDFSDSSAAALEMATDLALHFHAELHLVKASI